MLQPLNNFFFLQLGIQAEADLTNSSQIICWLDQDGLGLPDRDYYVLEEKAEIQYFLSHEWGANQAQIVCVFRGKYVAYVAKMFELAGETAEIAKQHAAVCQTCILGKFHFHFFLGADCDGTRNTTCKELSDSC